MGTQFSKIESFKQRKERYDRAAELGRHARNWYGAPNIKFTRIVLEGTQNFNDFGGERALAPETLELFNLALKQRPHLVLDVAITILREEMQAAAKAAEDEARQVLAITKS